MLSAQQREQLSRIDDEFERERRRQSCERANVTDQLRRAIDVAREQQRIETTSEEWRRNWILSTEMNRRRRDEADRRPIVFKRL